MGVLGLLNYCSSTRAEINVCNGAYRTPLHNSLLNDFKTPDADVVHLLLENGANVNVQDDQGRTPSQIANALMGVSDIKQSLSEHGGV